jgi:hypothetical protein
MKPGDVAFCGTKPSSGDVRLESAKCAKADLTRSLPPAPLNEMRAMLSCTLPWVKYGLSVRC